MLTPDAHINVKFYESVNGGRKGPTPKDFFRCILSIDGKNFDCRMILSDMLSIHPGDTKKMVPVAFINYEQLKKMLSPNKKFYIKDGGIVGEGEFVDFLK